MNLNWVPVKYVIRATIDEGIPYYVKDIILNENRQPEKIVIDIFNLRVWKSRKKALAACMRLNKTNVDITDTEGDLYKAWFTVEEVV